MYLVARLALQNLALKTTRRISIGSGIFSHLKDIKFRSSLSRLNWNKASIAKTTIWRSERRTCSIHATSSIQGYLQYILMEFLARSLRDQSVALIHQRKFRALETWSGYIFTATAMPPPHTRDSRLLLHQVSTALRYCRTERIAKRGSDTLLSRNLYFGFETMLQGHKNCLDGE